MGPNGTGKSTILCAICLGLGGDPPLLGRADDARTFIMHEKGAAMIEIELAPHRRRVSSQSPSGGEGGEGSSSGGEGEVHVIRRRIDRNKGSEKGKGRGASTFFVNGQEVPRKEVQRIVSEVYHIAVDNLCTFLPQDRVGSFSGFDSKALLIETEKSLSGSGHVYDQHQQLIRLEEEIRSSGTSEGDVRSKLKRLEEETARLEREKELMEERRRAVDNMTLYEQKRAWLLFDEARERAVDLKAVRDGLKDEVKLARKSLKPLEDKIGKMESVLTRSSSRREGVDDEMKRAAREYDKSMRKSEKFSDDIEATTAELASIDTMRRRAERAVTAQKDKVEEVERRLQDFPAGDDIERDYAGASEKMREVRAGLTRAKRDVSAASAKSREVKEAHKRAVSKLERAADDRARRNERIFRQNRNLHETYTWVDQNRKMFRRPIWGPVVCEIEPDSPEAATFVEQHVPRRVLVTYITECDEDYNLLFREVREKMGLHINISKVPGGKLEDPHPLYSDGRMRHLKDEHGVLGLLEEMFNAPPAVLQVLRNECSVNQVLVGTEKTQESIDRRNLLEELSRREDDGRGGRRGSGVGQLQGSCVFTSHMNKFYKYTSQVSRYSGKPTLRVDDIHPARMLAPGVSAEEKAQLEAEVDRLNEQVERTAPEEEATAKVYYDLQEQGQEVQRALVEAKNSRLSLKSFLSKLEQAKRKLAEFEEAVTSRGDDDKSEKDAVVARLRRHVSNSLGALEVAAAQHTRLMETTYTLAGIKMTEDGIAVRLRRGR